MESEHKGQTMMIMEVGDVILILMKDGTYVLPKEPAQCGRCLAMSGAFVNRNGDTFCCRCDVEERTSERVQMVRMDYESEKVLRENLWNLYS